MTRRMAAGVRIALQIQTPRCSTASDAKQEHSVRYNRKETTASHAFLAIEIDCSKHGLFRLSGGPFTE